VDLLGLDSPNDFDGRTISPLAGRPAQLGDPEDDADDDGQRRCEIRCVLRSMG